MPLIGVFLALALVAAPFVLPIISLIRQGRLSRRLDDLENTIALQERTIERLNARLSKVSAPAPETAPDRAPERPAPTPAVARAPVVTQEPVATHGPAAAPPPVVVPPPVIAPATPPSAAATPPPIEPPSYPEPAPAPSVPRVHSAADAAPPRLAPPRPPQRPPLPPPPPSPPEPSGLAAFDWEQLVGVRLFSAIAGIALVLAGIFFLRYSLDRGWLAPPVRVAIGVIVSTALLVVCERKAAQRYRVTANALDAASIAILFATFFAAHALWHLIPATVVFALLALVTVLAVLLSIRHESMFIAVLGLVGGFATPALLSTGENRPIPLFAYLLLLDVGLAWVARRKKWPLLALLSFLLTTLYQWAWVVKFLSSSQLPLAMGIFTACAVTAFAGLTVVRGAGEMDESLESTSLAAAIMPLVFAVFLAATPAYGAHPGLLFGFLLIMVLALMAIAIVREQDTLQAGAAIATLLVFGTWLARSYSPGDWVLAVVFLVVFVALFLVAPFIARRTGHEFGELGAQTVYAAPTLLFVFSVIVRMEPAVAAPLGLFAALFAALLMIAVYAFVADEAGPYLLASFFAVSAEAAWSAMHFTPDRVTAATTMYAAFGVFHLGVPIVLRRSGRTIQPAWGPGAVAIASLLLMLFFAGSSRAEAGLWGFALLVGILNAGLFIEAAGSRLPLISTIGGLLSWVVVGAWWRTAAIQIGPLPALLLIVGLTLIQLGGYAWSHAMSRGLPTAEQPRTLGAPARYHVLLALTGHLLLIATALDGRLVMPPWPLLGALAVVTLAMTATALAVSVAALHAIAVAAGALVVLTLARTLPGLTAIVFAAEAVIAYGLVSLFPLGRRGRSIELPSIGAALALFIGELTIIAAASPLSNAATLNVLIATQVVNLGAILALAWSRRWSWVGIGAVAMGSLTWVVWQQGHGAPGDWIGVLLLATAMYVVFVAYPIVLGRRTEETRDPYFTAIAGSIFFFFAARTALTSSPYASIIGIVPVVEAAVMAVLVRQLLRIQRTDERDLGRLALVAATSLAFVTVAIPLQLNHQWITIGWALEGAALAWLYTRVPHKGLLLATLALFAAVFARLALNPAIFLYEPRGMRILNWYLYAYTVAAAGMFLAAWWLKTTDDHVLANLPRASAVLPAPAVVLLFILLNIEVADFYATEATVTFRFGQNLSQDLTYTLAWLVFGMALLLAGIYLRSRAARISALALVTLTTFKAFLYDLGSLGGLYRVGSLVGLAISLALVALALQKFILTPKEAS